MTLYALGGGWSRRRGVVFEGLNVTAEVFARVAAQVDVVP